jgi:hypothetical protein
MEESIKYHLVRERLTLYEDFTKKLLYNIYKFYVDKESLNTDENINNHYLWCYNKTCDDFLMEEIDFKSNDNLKSYFFGYYYNQIYNVKKMGSLASYQKFWKEIFLLSNSMNKNSLKILIELYLIFDITIKEKIVQ